MKLPPASEWDFRKINEGSLLPALVYEYSRSSPILRAMTEQWFSAGCPPIPGNINDHLDCQDLPEEVCAIVRVLGGPPTLAWTSLKSGVQQRIINAWLWGATWPAARYHQPGDSPPWLKHKAQPQGFLTVDWNFSKKAILAEINKLLEENRPHPESKVPGRGGAAPFEALKYLAAYRLAKLTARGRATSKNPYADLQPLLKAERDRSGNGTGVLPIYESQSAWDRAVQKAGELISTAERGEFRFL